MASSSDQSEDESAISGVKTQPVGVDNDNDEEFEDDDDDDEEIEEDENEVEANSNANDEEEEEEEEEEDDDDNDDNDNGDNDDEDNDAEANRNGVNYNEEEEEEDEDDDENKTNMNSDDENNNEGMDVDDDDEIHAANEQDGMTQTLPKPATVKSSSFSAKDSIKQLPINLGGPIDKQAFALLDGMEEDAESGQLCRVTIPITRIPAILGRSHDSTDPHFFGLGSKKALSRKQCKIYYRDAEGGVAGQFIPNKDDVEYKKPNPNQQLGELIPTKQRYSDDVHGKKGFYVIECLGKNRILVNKEKVEHGKCARLTSGTSIRISSFMLYFLLPTDAENKILTIAPPPGTTTPSMKAVKKRKMPFAVPSSGAPAPSASKKPKASQGSIHQAELDKLPASTLLQRMTRAIENNQWERKHQLLGSTIALHAVKDSAKAPEVQKAAMEGGGVSRSFVMSWIETSEKYGAWVQQMLSKMEPRSYQAAVTKSLLKAGFTRTGSSGRYIKWNLPKHVKKVVGKKSDDTSSGNSKSKHNKKEKAEKKQNDQEDIEGRSDGHNDESESKGDVKDDSDEDDDGDGDGDDDNNANSTVASGERDDDDDEDENDDENPGNDETNDPDDEEDDDGDDGSDSDQNIREKPAGSSDDESSSGEE